MPRRAQSRSSPAHASADSRQQCSPGVPRLRRLRPRASLRPPPTAASSRPQPPRRRRAQRPHRSPRRGTRGKTADLATKWTRQRSRSASRGTRERRLQRSRGRADRAARAGGTASPACSLEEEPAPGRGRYRRRARRRRPDPGLDGPAVRRPDAGGHGAGGPGRGGRRGTDGAGRPPDVDTARRAPLLAHTTRTCARRGRRCECQAGRRGRL